MMKTSLSHRLQHKGLLLAILVASVGAGIVMVACSSGNGGGGGGAQNGPDSSTGGGGDDGGGGGGGEGGAPGACANPTLDIVFSPMYSAYIPGSSAQVFAIPAVMADGSTATWSLSDPSQANLQVQSFTNGSDTVPGVMITIAGTGNSMGQVTVYATESSGCGAATLTITNNTENDWTIGNARYNDGVSIHVGPPTGDGGFVRPDGGFMRPDGGGFGFGGGDSGSFLEQEGGTACTNCHGATGDTLFKDVAHTPEQTGGFSDTDLAGIILDGVIPDGGYFDPTVIIPTCDGGTACTEQAYNQWHHLHQWTDIQADQLPGIICYLRSLTPAPQTGTSNFGGGGHHFDGGAPPPMGDQ